MADRKQNTEIFREKSLDQASSPDNLNQYIRSTTPSLWFLLGAVIFLLLGILVWAGLGKIESFSTVGCRVESGELVVYIPENDYENLCEESRIEVNGDSYPIASVQNAALADADSDEFLLQAAGIESGDWYYPVICQTELADGEYRAKAVYSEVSPITFIMN